MVSRGPLMGWLLARLERSRHDRDQSGIKAGTSVPEILSDALLMLVNWLETNKGKKVKRGLFVGSVPPQQLQCTSR